MAKVRMEKRYKPGGKVVMVILQIFILIAVLGFYPMIEKLGSIIDYLKNDITWPPFIVSITSWVGSLLKILYEALNGLLGSTGNLINNESSSLNNLLMIIVFTVQFIILIKYLIKTKMLDYHSIGGEKYWSTLPEDLPPYVAAYIVSASDKKIGNSYAGELAMFIDKGYLTPIKINDTYAYYFNKTVEDDNTLWQYEKNLFNILYYKIANGKGQLSLDDFKKVENDRGKSFSVITDIVMSVGLVSYKEMCEKGYFENYLINGHSSGRKKKNIFETLLFVCTLILVFLMPKMIIAAVTLKLYWIIFAYIFGVILFVLKRSERREILTEKGKESCKKWTSFKKFLSNYSKFEDRGVRDIILWHEALAYATSFGIADKLSDEVNESGIYALRDAWIKLLISGDFAKIFKTRAKNF